MIMKEMPKFVFDPDMQRCEWVNSVLVITWEKLSQYACEKVRVLI
jgi:hypothetical protein